MRSEVRLGMLSQKDPPLSVQITWSQNPPSLHCANLKPAEVNPSLPEGEADTGRQGGSVHIPLPLY